LKMLLINSIKEIMSYLSSIANGINELRVFPRACIGVYLYILLEARKWFLLLNDPTTPQASYMSVLIGAGVGWFTAYVMSGNKKIGK